MRQAEGSFLVVVSAQRWEEWRHGVLDPAWWVAGVGVRGRQKAG